MKESHSNDTYDDDVPYNVHGQYTKEEAARLNALRAHSGLGELYKSFEKEIIHFYNLRYWSIRAGLGLVLVVAGTNFFYKFPHWLKEDRWEDFPLLTALQYCGYAQDVGSLIYSQNKGYTKMMLYILNLETWIAGSALVFAATLLMWRYCTIKIANRYQRVSSLFPKMF